MRIEDTIRLMIAARTILAAAFFLSTAQVAHATIYKCVDAQGRITYTNDRSLARSCRVLNPDQPISSIPPPQQRSAGARPPPAGAGPANFPRVSPGTQKARDQTRRQVLEAELEAEERSLLEARAQLNAQADTASPEGGSEADLAARLRPFQDRVALHLRNIEALRREIGSLK